MAETRKLAAILAADVVGYGRLAGSDEERTLARLRALRSDLVDPTIAVHHGRIVKRTGDGVLIEFRSVVDAVRCAIEMQNGMVERNTGAHSFLEQLLDDAGAWESEFVEAARHHALAVYKPRLSAAQAMWASSENKYGLALNYREEVVSALTAWFEENEGLQ
jgi:hypothetical protein